MTKKTLPNKLTLEDRIEELELLLLEESLARDELAEEVEALKEECGLLKEGPQIIIREIHHYHAPQWNYYPPVQIQPAPFYGNYPITLCQVDNKYLC